MIRMNRHDHFVGRHAGFTLVELLVVVAIIGILVSMTLPNVQNALANAGLSMFGDQDHAWYAGPPAEIGGVGSHLLDFERAFLHRENGQFTFLDGHIENIPAWRSAWLPPPAGVGATFYTGRDNT